MPKAGSPRKEDRTRELLAAALTEFAANGFGGTRLDDVASRAGVSKGTVYLYFASKEELFKAVVRSAIVPKIAAAEGELSALAGSCEALLRRVLTGFQRDVGDSELRVIVRLLIAEAGRFPELADFYYEEVVRRGLATIRAIVARGVETGEFRATALADFPQLLVAPVIMAIVWKTLFERRQQLETGPLIEAHLDLIMRALKEPGP